MWSCFAADKEAAEAEEKDRKAAEQAAKKEPESAIKQDDTVNTGDQSVLQVCGYHSSGHQTSCQ